MSFAEVTAGGSGTGCRVDRAVMEKVSASGIKPEASIIGGDRWSFILDSRDASRFTQALAELDIAATVRDGCSRVTLNRSAADWPLPPLNKVVRAFDAEGIDVVYLTGDTSNITVLVDDCEADRVLNVFLRFSSPAAA